MGLDSIWHWLILLVIVLALFGTKKLTKIGPDLGNAVREFKKALRGDDGEDDEADTDKAAGNESLKADPPAESAASSREHEEAPRDAKP